MIVDVTDFFWTLIRNIVYLGCDELKQSPEYEQMCIYVNGDETFRLRLRHHSIETKDVNELFQEARQFYRIYFSETEEYYLINEALKKIVNYLNTEQEIDHLFDKFNI